jgi:hypothetical protein
LVGSEPERILDAYRNTQAHPLRDCAIPPLWDGHAAERIVLLIKQAIPSKQPAC